MIGTTNLVASIFDSLANLRDLRNSNFFVSEVFVLPPVQLSVIFYKSIEYFFSLSFNSGFLILGTVLF